MRAQCEAHMGYAGNNYLPFLSALFRSHRKTCLDVLAFLPPLDACGYRLRTRHGLCLGPSRAPGGPAARDGSPPRRRGSPGCLVGARGVVEGGHWSAPAGRAHHDGGSPRPGTVCRVLRGERTENLETSTVKAASASATTASRGGRGRKIRRRSRPLVSTSGALQSLPRVGRTSKPNCPRPCVPRLRRCPRTPP
jgi:hypothetical protein